MSIVLAIDSFKECLTSIEANEAVKKALLEYRPSAKVVTVPVSDGGEGWIDAFQQAAGGERIDVCVHDPLMKPITASYLKIGDKAVIESAKVIGLALVPWELRNPRIATSYGLGEMIVQAVKDGCSDIMVGLGGTATNDCGVGMTHAVGDAINKLTETERRELPQHISFTIATDVTSPLCGPKGATRMFAQQKGADPQMVDFLEERTQRFARHIAYRMGYDCSRQQGAGAAGGLGYAFMQWFDAEIKKGAELLLNTLDFNALIADADMVITGEGRIDRQTIMGKLPYQIIQQTALKQIPTIVLAGQTYGLDDLKIDDHVKIININPPGISVEKATDKSYAVQRLKTTVHSLMDNSQFANFKG